MAGRSSGRKHWKSWNEAMKESLLPAQIRSGDSPGSWPPAAGFDRLTTTALNVLTLETYYRYPAIHGLR